MNRQRLLWVGDAVVASGFAKATHETLRTLCKTWDVHVLGLNYVGDPHPYPYRIYPAAPGGDAFGVRRVAAIVDAVKPNLVVIQNDPWNVPMYLDQLKNVKVPVVGALPVDGLNCRGAALNRLAHAIFWTEFGKAEARAGGYTGPASVVPLGVDLKVFSPGDRVAARRALGLRPEHENAFIVGNVNRNQPRKRLDLTIAYFAEWIRTFDVNDAYLYLHVCPTGDVGYDIKQLIRYFGATGRVIISEPEIGYGVDEVDVVNTYRAFDAQVNTGQGEGMGLTTLEGMACGVQQIVGDWAALGDWTYPAAVRVPCSTIAVTPGGVNVVGGIPDRAPFVAALDHVYRDAAFRRASVERGLAVAARPEYRWENIGTAFARVLHEVMVEAYPAFQDGGNQLAELAVPSGG